jgi:hypothetical protein
MRKIGMTLAAIGAALALTTLAFAGDEMVSVSNPTPGTVVVSAQGDWKVNKNYPWNITVGSTTTNFSLDDKTATATGIAAGRATIKGTMCRTGQDCKMFTKQADVK